MCLYRRHPIKLRMGKHLLLAMITNCNMFYLPIYKSFNFLTTFPNNWFSFSLIPRYFLYILPSMDIIIYFGLWYDCVPWWRLRLRGLRMLRGQRDRVLRGLWLCIGGISINIWMARTRFHDVLMRVELKIIKLDKQQNYFNKS